jgi:hypothetical protein
MTSTQQGCGGAVLPTGDGTGLAPDQNMENNPMQSSRPAAGKDALRDGPRHLTRRANHLHYSMIAQFAGIALGRCRQRAGTIAGKIVRRLQCIGSPAANDRMRVAEPWVRGRNRPSGVNRRFRESPSCRQPLQSSRTSRCHVVHQSDLLVVPALLSREVVARRPEHQPLETIARCTMQNEDERLSKVPELTLGFWDDQDSCHDAR